MRENGRASLAGREHRRERVTASERRRTAGGSVPSRQEAKDDTLDQISLEVDFGVLTMISFWFMILQDSVSCYLSRAGLMHRCHFRPWSYPCAVVEQIPR